MNETEKKIAEIEERRKARKAERAARAPSSDEEKLLEAQRLDALEAAVVEAEEKHGAVGRGIAVVHAKYADGTLLGSVIVKRPVSSMWLKFQGVVADKTGAPRDEEIQKLWRHCLVWPKLAEAEKLVEELPNLSTKMLEVISRLAGEHSEEVAGK